MTTRGAALRIDRRPARGGGETVLRVDGGDPSAARLHHHRGQFWIEPLEVGAIKEADGAAPREHELLLLRAGAQADPQALRRTRDNLSALQRELGQGAGIATR